MCILTAPLQGGVCTWEDEGGGKGEGGRGGEGSGERESCEAKPRRGLEGGAKLHKREKCRYIGFITLSVLLLHQMVVENC